MHLGSMKAMIASVLEALEHREAAERITLTISPRLRTSLATSTPSRLEIRLRPDVLDAPPDVQREILTHELAHLVVARRHPNARPHGPEWQALMRQAGYEPRTHIPFDGTVGGGQPGRNQPKHGQWLYVHRCPVCHWSRTAKKPMHRWRCRSCTEAGLDGSLVITRTRRRGD
jgi:predicted SprT family Zn-dependent metalloprotease